MSSRADETPADVTGVAERSTVPGDSVGDSTSPLVELPQNDRRYAIVGEHKAGGQGRVLEAEDRWLHRRVALKEPLGRGADTEARFLREAMITARLQHPAIVPVYDAGRDAEGRPFFAMKMVIGRSLRDIIAQRRTLDERLALVPNVIAVVEAIAYAHSQGVIHRDLKPSNVLVGPFGETVVIDWGLAKTLEEPEPTADPDPTEVDPASRSSSDLTRAGEIVGTPQYMAPEQAAGQPADERADVYSLGALLYEVLCGEAPYPIEGPRVVEAVVAAPPPPIGRRQPGVPEDLAAIVDKAMARRREDRYATAGELVEDVRRFQTGRLLASRRYSRWERSVRWMARHRALVGFLVLLSATMTVAGWRVVGERNRARRAADLLLLAQARQAMTHDPTLALAWLRQYPQDGAHAAEARALAMEAVARGVAWRVWHQEEIDDVRAMWSPTGNVFAIAGKGADGLSRLHICDVARDRCSPPFEREGRYFATSIADGQHTLVHSPGDQLHDVWPGQDAPLEKTGDRVAQPHGEAITLEARGVRVELRGHERKVIRLAFSPDGRRLGSVAEDHSVRIWTLPGDAIGEPVSAENAQAMRLSPDGKTLAVLRANHGLALWDLATRKLRGDCSEQRGVRTVEWSPDSQKLAVAAEGGARVLDAATCAVSRRLGVDVAALAYSPRGDRLAGTAPGGAVWLGAGDDMNTTLPSRAPMHQVAFSPDGALLAAGGDDYDVHLWELASRAPLPPLAWHSHSIDRLVFAPSGGRLVSGATDGLVAWDLASGRPLLLASGHAIEVDFSPDGAWLAAAFADGTTRLYDLAAGRALTLAGASGHVNALRFSSDSAHLAAAFEDGGLRVWEVRSRSLEAVFRHEPAVRDVVFLPGGAALISAGDGLRRFALAAAPHPPEDLAKLAGWIDERSAAPLEILAPGSHLDPQETP